MEAERHEVEKLNLNHLPVEFRRQLLDSMTDQLQLATNPMDIKCLEVGIENLKKSLV